MNAPEIVDVLVPRIDVLHPVSGDVIALSIARPMSDDEMTALALNMRRLLLERGKSVLVAVLPPGMSIEKLDEDGMRALGWVRATQESEISG